MNRKSNLHKTTIIIKTTKTKTKTKTKTTIKTKTEFFNLKKDNFF